MASKSTPFIAFAETSQYVCSCGDKHDEFDLGTLRVQFCPVNNSLTTLEETPVECEQEHDPACDLPHLREHDHTLKTDLGCGFTQVISCDYAYTGGHWKRKNADA